MQWKSALTQLEAKVAQPTPNSAHGTGTAPSNPNPQTRSDWSELGGEQGDTLVLGGFRAHSTSEERREELQKIMTLLPEDLASQISSNIIPEPRTNIVLLKIKLSEQRDR